MNILFVFFEFIYQAQTTTIVLIGPETIYLLPIAVDFAMQGDLLQASAAGTHLGTVCTKAPVNMRT